MATFDMRPNGTVLNQWTVSLAATAHEALDDVVTQPNGGNESDGYISTTGNNSTFDLDLTAPTDVQSASQLVVWIEARNLGDEQIALEIRDAIGTVLASSTVTPPANVYGWLSLSLSGQSWTQTDVNGLRLAGTAKKVGGGAQSEMRVRAAYGVLTYTAASSGASITAVVASATGSAPAPTVVAVRNVSVSGVVAGATATALAPAVSAISNVSLAAPVAGASASFHAPSASISATVDGVVGGATGTASAPTITAIKNVSVAVPVLAATGSAHAPTVDAEAPIFVDEFNDGSIHPNWTEIDPRNDVTVTESGGVLSIAIPSGADHDLYNNTDAPRILQSYVGQDFDIVTKWNSNPASVYQGHGITIYDDANNLINLYVYYGPHAAAGGANRLHGIGTTRLSGTPSTHFDTIATGRHNYIRGKREGDTFTLYTSSDGTTWTQEGQLTQSLPGAVQIGVFALNAGGASAPAYTATLDAFRNFSANVTAVKATATGTAHAPTVSITSPNVTISAPVMTATATAHAPTVSTTSSVTIAAVVSAATASALVPTVTAVKNATITSVVAGASASAPAPSVSTTRAVTVAAPVAGATGAALAPSVSGAGSVLITAPAMSATANAVAPTVSAVRNVTVSATASTGTGSMLAPSITATKTVTLNAPVATATATAHPPTITAVKSVGVLVPSAAATATAYPVSISSGDSVTLVAPVADVSAQAYPPALSVSVTVSVPVASASAQAHAASLPNTSLTAPAATANARAHEPVVGATSAKRADVYTANYSTSMYVGSFTGTLDSAVYVEDLASY